MSEPTEELLKRTRITKTCIPTEERFNKIDHEIKSLQKYNLILYYIIYYNY